jgi:hypothetical protein
LLAWLQLADFGLGNGLTNALATDYGNDRPDLARRYVSTSLAMLTGVKALIGGACALAWPKIDWNAVFNVGNGAVARAEVGPATAAR